MDPLYEQRLRDEVLYLHSLWHQGPPRSAATPSTPTPTRTPTAATRYHLQPPKPTQFKKKGNRTGKTRMILPTPDSCSSRSGEWPCPVTLPPTTAWPAGGGPALVPPPLSPEEQSKLAAKRAHQHALEVVREFFMKEGSDEMEISDDDDMSGDCSDEQYDFLFKLFEDSKLKEYYHKNFVTKEFSCLVCEAVGGKNSSRKFKGCLPLVQHSISIAKTKRTRTHRAFAQAVCKVLDWDIDRLPQIVSMLSDKSGNTNTQMQGNSNGDNDDNTMACVDNVDWVKADTSNDKGEWVEPASDAGKNLEEPAPDGLTISNSACHDADKTENQVSPRGPAAIVSAAEADWSCSSCPGPPLDMPSTGGWTTTICTQEKSSPKALSSPEELLILAARHAHQNALKIVQKFFRTNKSDEIDTGSDNDDDDDDDDVVVDDDDDEELMEEDSEGEKYSLFIKVFEESTELREYYVKNFAEGEFSCLVCGAADGKRTGKKFKGCFPLVQHSITISKRKKREAHRAFGQAVCKVLDWDIANLCDIASMLSENTGEIQQSIEEPASLGLATDIISSVNMDADKIENLDMTHQHNVEQASEGSVINLTYPDADRNLENDNLHGDNSVDPIAG